MTAVNTDPVDYACLIDRLGGPAVVQKDLGMPEIGFRTVYFWHRRNSVPGAYAPALLSLAIARKVISSLEDAPRVDPFAAPSDEKDPDT